MKKNLWMLGAELVAGFVLCVATALAITYAGWVKPSPGLVLVAVVGFVEAALLAGARMPRRVTIAMAPLLVMAIVVPLTVNGLPAIATANFGAAFGVYLNAMILGVLSPDAWQFTVGISVLVWICGYWCAWMTVREGSGVMVALSLAAVLAINAFNSPSVAGATGPTLIALFAMLLFLGANHFAVLESTRRGIFFASQSVRHFAVSATSASALVLLIALALPPVTSTDLTTRLFPKVGTGGGTEPSNYAGPFAAVGFSPNTEPGGPLADLPRPVLRYTTTPQTPVYLRIANDTSFDAGNWYSYPRQAGASTVSLLVAAGPLPRDRNPADGGVGVEVQPVALHISDIYEPPTGNTVDGIFPGEPDSIDHSATVTGVVNGTIGSLPRDVKFLTVDQVNLNTAPTNVSQMETTGLVSTATAAQLRAVGAAPFQARGTNAAGISYPDFVQPDLVINDDDTQGLIAIRSLAFQWTQGTTNAYDAAMAIENHLRDTSYFKYTLTPPQAPGNEWPIVYFLTTSQQGYCQYFASSMGAMLRAIGIPARLVSGYGPGTQEQTAKNNAASYQVTTGDAHVWVEAYFPGYGWIPFEPTPSSPQGDYQPFARGAAALRTPDANVSPGATVPATPRPGANPNTRQTQPHSNGAPVIVYAAVAVVLLLIVAFIAAFVWRRPHNLAGVWRRIEITGRVAHIPRGKSETRRAYANRLGARIESAEELRTIARMAECAEFSQPGTETVSATEWHEAWRHARRRALRRAVTVRRKETGVS